jgi:DNA-binding NarL/FixJ family response regulator
MEQIKIGLVDDNERWLKGFCSFLNGYEDLTVIWSTADRETALRYAENSLADIILMDVNFDDHDLIGNYAKIIIVSSTDDCEPELNSFMTGAVNYINKKDFEKIPDLVRSVFHNSHPSQQI